VSLRHYVAVAAVLGAALPAAADSGAAAPIVDRPIEHRAPDTATNPRLAQFALPKRPAKGKARPPPIPKALQFEYVYGGELESIYSRDSDLDRSVADDSHVATPNVFGSITYRPVSWLQTTAELKFERPVGLREEEVVVLPDGELQSRGKKEFNLFFSQAFVKLKPASAPLELTVGRRNFEDARLSLYDTELDAVILTVKPGDFNIEASVSRAELKDLDLLANLPAGEVTNQMVYAEYRGIEDHKLAAYFIAQRDSGDEVGRPRLFGARAHGRPMDRFNYWAELAALRGTDEAKQNFDGHAFEAGATYRFLDSPLQPNITLSYAWGSGDGDSADGSNGEFRQTGLQSNESKMGGVSQFKSYGEALDPELSNLEIMTAGIGFRPAAGIFVDLVYHRYRLNSFATTIRNDALTALMNGESKDVGDALDVIVGFRNLFGVRGLGADVRAGWFFPGDAFGAGAGNGFRMVTKIFF
jgi:alginate production protein